jgi:hypothetical protein
MPTSCPWIIILTSRKTYSKTLKATISVALIFICLFSQVSQVLFHRLDLELELFQVGFQLFDLLGLGQKLALKAATISAAAFATAVAFAILAITLFVHIISPRWDIHPF